jgi:hypothetical protein
VRRLVAPNFKDADVIVARGRDDVLEARWIVVEGRGGIQEMANQFVPHTVSGNERSEQSVGHAGRLSVRRQGRTCPPLSRRSPLRTRTMRTSPPRVTASQPNPHRLPISTTDIEAFNQGYTAVAPVSVN